MAIILQFHYNMLFYMVGEGEGEIPQGTESSPLEAWWNIINKITGERNFSWEENKLCFYFEMLSVINSNILRWICAIENRPYAV